MYKKILTFIALIIVSGCSCQQFKDCDMQTTSSNSVIDHHDVGCGACPANKK